MVVLILIGERSPDSGILLACKLGQTDSSKWYLEALNLYWVHGWLNPP